MTSAFRTGTLTTLASVTKSARTFQKVLGSYDGVVLGFGACARLADELPEDGLQLGAELVVDELPVLVEAARCARDGDAVLDDPRAHGLQHLAQLGLRPDGAEHAGGR